MKKRIGLVLISILILLGLVPACRGGQDFDSQFGRIAGPYRFNAFKWEVDAFAGQVAKMVNGDYRSEPDAGQVVEYFARMRKTADLQPFLVAVTNGDRAGDPEALASELDALGKQTSSSVRTVENTLEKQIHDTLAAQGIFNPLYDFLKLRFGFPPVSLKVAKPINLLVVSRRNRIGTIRQAILKADLSVADTERIEQQVDRLGVSSLVVELGGTAVTYPTFVSNRGSLRHTIDAAVEEWVHQYLAFKPLGSRYVWHLLGMNDDRDIVAMNETVAGMVSREIGGMVYSQYYQQYDKAPPRRPDPAFNREMRDIRRQVDSYLAAGQTDQAEQYLNDSRQRLASQGFYLRKLNQAYFSFYGNYASAPGSITPVGGEFQKLRAQSQSVGEFLDKAASLTDHKQLEEMIR